MKSELLAKSPLLALPLVALFMFIAIFGAIFVLTMRKKAAAYEPCARLPLSDGHDDETGESR
jgi:cbb3-type cytochrome oxidase subunit 3